MCDFGYRLMCSFAHRMRSTRGHTPILRVLQAAADIIIPVESIRQEAQMTEEEREKWMQARRRSMAKLREKKSSRRGGEKWCGETTCELALSAENVVDVVRAEPVSDVRERALPNVGLNGPQIIPAKTIKQRKAMIIDVRKLRQMTAHGKR
jgi:hypothetical protein